MVTPRITVRPPRPSTAADDEVADASGRPPAAGSPSVASLAGADGLVGSGRQRGQPAAQHRRRRRIFPPVGGLLGLAIAAVLVVAATVGPLLLPTAPATQDLAGRLAPPVWGGGGWDHPLGTDGLGRDLLARVIAVARVSLLVGVAATLVAGVFGVALGLVAGSLGGWVDRAVTWAADVQLALPFVVVAVAVAATLGPSLRNVVLVLAVTGWVGYARIVRLQARTLRSAPFVEAARALGAGRGRLLLRHLLPNLLGPVAVVASQQVAAMVLYEAALSYLGLGVPSETVTWGRMVADGQETLATAWWVSAVPGAALALAVLGGNLLGDWAADALARRG
jgi:peptide/nickel transport system permease protein